MSSLNEFGLALLQVLTATRLEIWSPIPLSFKPYFLLISLAHRADSSKEEISKPIWHRTYTKSQSDLTRCRRFLYLIPKKFVLKPFNFLNKLVGSSAQHTLKSEDKRPNDLTGYLDSDIGLTLLFHPRTHDPIAWWYLLIRLEFGAYTSRPANFE